MNTIFKKPILIIITLYLLATAVLTFPTVLRINSEIPTRGSDTYQAVGAIDEQAKILKEEGVLTGARTIISNHKLNIFTPYAFLNLVFNKFLSFNLLFLLSFFLSALGAYLLAYYFTKNVWASFLAGLVFAFSPYHFYQSLATHAGIMHQEWMPFFALFLFRFFEDFKFRYFSWAAFFFILIAFTEHQMLAFTVVFIALFVIYKLFTDFRSFKNKRLLAYVGTSIVLLVVLIYAFYLPYLQIATSENNFLDAGEKQAERYAISFADPFIPAPFHPLWGGMNKYVLGCIQKNTPLDVEGNGEKGSSSFLGYSTLFLLVVSLISYFRNKAGVVIPASEPEAKNNPEILNQVQNDIVKENKKYILFWWISVAIFYIFALGPTLDIGKHQVYLPYYLVYKYLPFYENIRTTGRFFIYAILGASVLSAYGLAWLIDRYPNKKKFLAGTFSVMLIIEFLALPLKTETMAYSPFYDRIAKETGGFQLIEIPGATSYDFASYEMITEVVHGKEVMNGASLARIVPHEFEFQKTTPVIKQLLYYKSGKDLAEAASGGVIEDKYFDLATEILNYYSVRYVTIQKRFTENPDKLANVDRFMRFNVALEDVYEDDFLVAYKIAQKDPRGYYATLIDYTDNWGESEKDKSAGVSYKPADSGAQLLVVDMEKSPKKLEVNLNIRSKGARKITIEDADGQTLAAFDITPDWHNYSFKLEARSGENKLTFKMYDRDGKELKLDGDSREKEGVFFQKISFVEEK